MVRATATENSHAERNAHAQSLSCGAGFRLDLYVLADVVENADADVIKMKIFLDMTNNFQQHLLRIFAGDGSLGNAVEKSELPGTALFFGKQARIFDCDRNLACRRLHYFQIALLEDIFAVRAHYRHDSCWLSTEQDGTPQKHLDCRAAECKWLPCARGHSPDRRGSAMAGQCE